jgi:hypothetical protein
MYMNKILSDQDKLYFKCLMYLDCLFFPADSYKRIVEDKLGHTSSKRRHNDPYLVVKFVVAPVDEHVDN